MPHIPHHQQRTALLFTLILSLATLQAITAPADNPNDGHHTKTREHVICDMETGIPLGNVQIVMDNGDHEAVVTDYRGHFTLPDQGYQRLTLLCSGYLRRLMEPHELTDTIKLIPTMARLHEVVIWGQHRKTDLGMAQELKTIQEAAKLPSPGNNGLKFDFFSLFSHGSKRKTEERKKAIENY